MSQYQDLVGKRLNLKVEKILKVPFSLYTERLFMGGFMYRPTVLSPGEEEIREIIIEDTTVKDVSEVKPGRYELEYEVNGKSDSMLVRSIQPV